MKYTKLFIVIFFFQFSLALYGMDKFSDPNAGFMPGDDSDGEGIIVGYLEDGKIYAADGTFFADLSIEKNYDTEDFDSEGYDSEGTLDQKNSSAQKNNRDQKDNLDRIIKKIREKKRKCNIS